MSSIQIGKKDKNKIKKEIFKNDKERNHSCSLPFDTQAKSMDENVLEKLRFQGEMIGSWNLQLRCY